MFAGGAHLEQHLLLDGATIFVSDVEKAHASGAAARDVRGDIEIVERGGELPLVAVQAPDLELLKACHFR